MVQPGTPLVPGPPLYSLWGMFGWKEVGELPLDSGRHPSDSASSQEVPRPFTVVLRVAGRGPAVGFQRGAPMFGGICTAVNGGPED